jgi:hypothetical protein
MPETDLFAVGIRCSPPPKVNSRSVRVLSCCGRVPDMRAQACCTPRIATAMRADGESIVNIRMTTLRGAGRGDRSVCMSAACVALPLCNATASGADVTLHCTKTTRHLGKTTRQFTADARIAAETPLHGANAPLHGSEALLSCSNVPRHRCKTPLHSPESTRQTSNASLHCSNASLFHSGARGFGRCSTGRHAPARTSCVVRGRRIARMTGSHTKVPAPHWRSTVFK